MGKGGRKMKKTIKSKIRNAEKLIIVKVTNKERYLVLAYKNESMGVNSNYKRVPCVYVLSLFFDRGYYNSGKITGKNIKVIERKIQLSINNGEMTIENSYPEWDYLPDYISWKISNLRQKSKQIQA